MINILVSASDLEIAKVEAKKEQKEVNGISDEIGIFTAGSQYWESFIVRGEKQKVLNPVEVRTLKVAINYCNGIYAQLSKSQIKEINRIVEKLKENGIE